MIFNEKLERLLVKVLPFYIFFIFIVTILNSYLYFLDHHPYIYGDWLINYQAAFVRRGFIGELVYQLSLFFHINIGSIVFLLHLLFYGTLFYFSYKLLKLQDRLLPYILLIFSPFIFNFQVFSSEGGYKKELIFLVFLSLLVYWAKTRKHFNIKFYIILCLCPLAILSHEMIFFFIPYLYIVYFYVNDGEEKYLKKLILFSSPSFICFFVVILFGSADLADVNQILNSLSNIGYSITVPINAIFYLDKDIFYGFNMVQHRFFREYYYVYFIQLLFAFVAFIPLKKKVQAIFKNKLFLILIVTSIAMSVILFLVAIDWGRWIYIHLFSFFLITLLINNSDDSFDEKTGLFQPLLNKTNFLVIFVLIYLNIWHITPLGSTLVSIPRNIKQLRIFRYAKPFIFIAFHYNPLLKKSCKEMIRLRFDS